MDGISIFELGLEHAQCPICRGSEGLDPLASFFDPSASSFWPTPGGRLDTLKFITCNPLQQTTQK